MDRKDRPPLAERVARAAESALQTRNYVSAVDVFMEIGWLPPTVTKDWQQGRSESLESVIQVNPQRLSAALELLRSWAIGKGLLASETQYVARTPQRQALRFSRSGEPELELLYRTHWMSPAIPEKKRERLVRKASREPELVVIQPLNREWSCHRCGGTGDLLMMDGQGPACLRCVGLADLEFLPPGDALLTRRTKAKSARYAVVVRFSRSRRRYERRGLLVEPQALAEVRSQLEEQGPPSSEPGRPLRSTSTSRTAPRS